MPPGVSDIRRFGDGGGCNDDEEAKEVSGSIGESLDDEGDGRCVGGWPSSARARALPMSIIGSDHKRHKYLEFQKKNNKTKDGGCEESEKRTLNQPTDATGMPASGNIRMGIVLVKLM